MINFICRVEGRGCLGTDENVGAADVLGDASAVQTFAVDHIVQVLTTLLGERKSNGFTDRVSQKLRKGSAVGTATVRVAGSAKIRWRLRGDGRQFFQLLAAS